MKRHSLRRAPSARRRRRGPRAAGERGPRARDRTATPPADPLDVEGDRPSLLLPGMANRPSLATLATGDSGRPTGARARRPARHRPAARPTRERRARHALSHAAPLEAAQHVAASGATPQAAHVVQERSSARGDVTRTSAGRPRPPPPSTASSAWTGPSWAETETSPPSTAGTAGTGAPEPDLGFVSGDLFATLLLAPPAAASRRPRGPAPWPGGARRRPSPSGPAGPREVAAGPRPPAAGTPWGSGRS